MNFVYSMTTLALLLLSTFGNGMNIKSADPGEKSEMAEIDGRTYYIETSDAMNWYDAKKFCLSLQMQLVSLETAEENAAVLGYLNANHLGVAFYTSGFDAQETSTYLWDATGERVMYYDWSQNEPSKGWGEKVITLLAIDPDIEFKWHDTYDDGNFSQHPLCEQV